jgi:hypothetical protein
MNATVYMEQTKVSRAMVDLKSKLRFTTADWTNSIPFHDIWVFQRDNANIELTKLNLSVV